MPSQVQIYKSYLLLFLRRQGVKLDCTVEDKKWGSWKSKNISYPIQWKEQSPHQRPHPPNFSSEILSKIWVNSFISESKSWVWSVKLRQILIHDKSTHVEQTLNFPEHADIFNWGLLSGMNIVKLGRRCGILWFFDIPINSIQFDPFSQMTQKVCQKSAI